jgi:hypothetical protein
MLQKSKKKTHGNQTIYEMIADNYLKILLKSFAFLFVLVSVSQIAKAQESFIKPLSSQDTKVSFEDPDPYHAFNLVTTLKENLRSAAPTPLASGVYCPSGVKMVKVKILQDQTSIYQCPSHKEVIWLIYR